MVELVWKIVHLKLRPSYKEKQNVVTEVHWRLEAVEQGHQAAVYGSFVLPIDNLETIIPYDFLKETDVVQWVKDMLGADKLVEFEQTLQRQLAISLAPEIVDGEFPWIPKSTEAALV